MKLFAVAFVCCLAVAAGQVNFNPVSITVTAPPTQILATPITPALPYSQAAFQCNVTGDSRYPPFALGTFPLNVSVPVGTLVRIIFANGNLGGTTVTQPGQAGVIVQQGGVAIVQQAGGASPIVQNPSSPIVQQNAAPAALVVQQSPTVVQPGAPSSPIVQPTPSTPAPTPRPGTTTSPGSPSPVTPTPATPATPAPTTRAPTPAPTTPASTTPAATTPAATTPAATTPAATTPAATTPAATTPAATTPAATTPAATTPAATTPAATTPAATTPAATTPAATTPAATTPAATPMQSCPAGQTLQANAAGILVCLTASTTPTQTPCPAGQTLQLNEANVLACTSITTSGRKLLQNTVPGGPNNGLVEYVGLIANNTVSGFVVPNTQFGVPYVEFTATAANVGQVASFMGSLVVANVIGGVPQIPFIVNPSLSPFCQVNVNFRAIAASG